MEFWFILTKEKNDTDQDLIDRAKRVSDKIKKKGGHPSVKLDRHKITISGTSKTFFELKEVYD